MSRLRSPHARGVLLVAAAYLAVALFAFRAVLADPSGLLATTVSEGPIATVCRWDQSVAVATIARHAQVLVTEPSKLLDGFQCFPLPRSHTIGEHMFGTGLLATIPWLLTRDPILTYNLVLVLSVWIAGMAMYAFAYHYVRDVGASFVAGMMFALEMPRVFDPEHPFAYADMWTPLAMLFLHRLFARGGVGNALAFAAFGSLLVMQSLYPLVSGAIVLAFYSVHLAITYRRELLARLPAMALALAALGLVAAVVLGPYLDTRAAWGLLSDRVGMPPMIGLPLLTGGLVLSFVAMADRLRGPRPREGSDPRVCFFVAALFLMACGSALIPVPGTGILLPSPLRLVRMLPGGDAVRGMASISSGSELPVAVLAAYAVHALLERAPRRVAVAVATALSLYVVAERLHPPLSGRIYGGNAWLNPWAARPPVEDVELVRSTAGPVLDLPYAKEAGVKSFVQADYLRLTSFDTRQSSSCYASYASPLRPAIAELAAALPAPRAADALYALGFRTVLVHVDDFWRPAWRRFERALQQPRNRSRLEEVGRTERLVAYRLKSPFGSSSDLRLLAIGAKTLLPTHLARDASELAIPITNAGPHTFVHPSPIRPTDVVVRWTDAGGAVVKEHRERVLLPLALAPGASQPLSVASAPPAPGRYVVSVAPLDRPKLVLGRLAVEVRDDGPRMAG